MAAKSKTRMPHAAPLPPGLLAPLDVLKEGEDTVTLVVQSPLILTLANRRKIYLKRGTQEVPAHLADHPYLAANGAEVYNSGKDELSEPKTPAKGSQQKRR